MTRLPRLLLLPFLFASSALADSADLRLVAGGDNHLSVTMAMVNDGPDIARNAVVTIDAPAELGIRLLVAGGSCDTSRRPIRCPMGDLNVRQPIRYGGVDFTAPIADATYTATITLTSDTPDPNPANNTISASWTTKVEADLTPFITRLGDRVDPGQTVKFEGRVFNNVENNRPPSSVRVDFSVTNGVISALTPLPGFTCTVDGATATCLGTAVQTDFHDKFDISVLTSSDRKGGPATLTMVANSDVPDRRPEDNRAEATIPIYRWIAVTSTADAGPGSLRDAIHQANAGCSPGPCRIVFEIPGPVPSEGWFTITPSQPLPSIVADRVTLEGSRQTALTGDTNPNGPEVAIDGRLAHQGLKMLSTCEGVVEGLAIGNFDEDQGLWIASRGYTIAGPCGTNPAPGPDRREVSGNHIGVDPTGAVPWPNLRGLRADYAFVNVSRNVISHNLRSGVWMWLGGISLEYNRLEHNGASGILLGPEVVAAAVLGNTISNHPQMGVAVLRGAKLVDIRGNSMKDNGGLGIDWGLDGVSPMNDDDRNDASNAPVLLSASYDAASNMTRVTLTVASSPLGNVINAGVVDAYTNAGPDGDGEQWIGSRQTPRINGTMTIEVPGDHRGKWLNATWTRVHWIGLRGPRISSNFYAGADAVTSELSNTVLVE
jgi:Domain of unknown function DUF11/Right handed beta helix region